MCVNNSVIHCCMFLMLLPRYIQGASGLWLYFYCGPGPIRILATTYIFCLHFPTDFGGKTLLMLEGYNTLQTV